MPLPRRIDPFWLVPRQRGAAVLSTGPQTLGFPRFLRYQSLGDLCPSGSVTCLNGACLSLGPACDADGDCERGLWCIRGICLDPEAGPSI